MFILKRNNMIGTNNAKETGWALKGFYSVILFFLIGCAVGPDFVRPNPPTVDRYTSGSQPTATIAADGQAQQFEQGAKIAADWWRLFNSSEVDAVIKEAITNNQTLQAAQASLRQSQENLRAGYGVFYPQLDVGFDATRQKFSPARFGGSAASSIFNLYTLTATVSYALDLFGGERRAVESLRAQIDFERDMVLATYLTLSGNIVNTIIAQAAYREQIKATEQIISLQREQTGITEIQAQAGTVPYSNVLSLRSQLACYGSNTSAAQTKAEPDRALARHPGRSRTSGMGTTTSPFGGPHASW